MIGKERVPVLCAVFAAATLGAQQQWFPVHVAPGGNRDVRLCAIEPDGRIVATGIRAGSAVLETWEWLGSWRHRSPSQAPPIRSDYGLANDPDRAVVVLFGGADWLLTPFGDTWEWNGVDWTQRQPSPAPSARSGAALAFDGNRRRVALYGGRAALSSSNEHWEWDGAQWTQVNVATNPGGRIRAGMAFDESRRRLVLCGGNSSAVDVWEFDGQQWRTPNPPPAPGPPVLQSFAVVYDPAVQRTVVFGGRLANTAVNSLTWEWDGAQWHSFTPGTHPPAFETPGLAFDRASNRLVSHGGSASNESWLHDRSANTWNRAPFVVPSGGGAAANDGNGGTLLVTSSWWESTTWTWRWDHATTSWRSVQTAAQPPGGEVAFVFDQSRSEGVLLHNALGSSRMSTWVFDVASQNWLQRSTGPRPSSRTDAALAYDVGRGRILLFGGAGTASPGIGFVFADTWEWDGTSWSAPPITSWPQARRGAGAAYDFVRGNVVLFGGDTLSGLLNDVWEWDGASWSQRLIVGNGPQPRVNAAVCSRYDGVLVLGGNDGSASHTPLPGAWLLNGFSWTFDAAADLPLLAHAAAVSDLARREVVVFGASSGGSGDTPGTMWMHGVVPAHAHALGGGCSGSLGLPVLAARGLPVIGNAAFAVDASSFVANQPMLFAAGLRAQVTELPGRCRLFVAPDLLVFGTLDSGGAASLPLSVPAAPALAGVAVFAQAAALDPAAAAGFAFTPALELRVGR